MIKVRRPARTMLQLLNTREKVFRPQWEFFFPENVPSPACSLCAGERRRDFVFSASFGVRRQSEEATALWIARSTTFDLSKAASRYACRRTPNFVSLGADNRDRVVLWSAQSRPLFDN